MRIVIKEIKVYSFNEASPELREKIREYFSSDYHLYDIQMEERIETLQAFADFVDADLDYSISCVPDRGEFISLKPHFSFGNTFERVVEFVNDKQDCTLTGVCYDDDLKYYLKGKVIDDQTLKDCFNNYIKSIHDEYEYMLTDKYLSDLCEANNYEFTDDGKIY